MNIYQNDDFGYTFTKNPEQFKEGKLFYVGSDGEKHTLKRVDSPFHALGAIFLPSTLPEYFTHIRRQVMKHAKTRGYRWEEIDLDNALWSIPPERMKMGRAHTVPLTKQMLTLLEDMQPMSGHREYVFPADRDPTRHTHEQTANMALKRMGYAGLLVAHGLRSIASTALNEQGFDPDVIESALAHVDSNDVRRAYNRADYLERRKVVMCWWSDFIEQAATGNLSLASSNRGLKVIAN